MLKKSICASINNRLVTSSHLLKQQFQVRLHRHINDVGPIQASPERIHIMYDSAAPSEVRNRFISRFNETLPTSSSASGDSGPFGSHTGPCRSSPHWGHYRQRWKVSTLWLIKTRNSWRSIHKNCKQSLFKYTVARYSVKSHRFLVFLFQYLTRQKAPFVSTQMKRSPSNR